MNRILLLFLVLSLTHIGAELANTELTYFTKPLLMPVLGLYLLSNHRGEINTIQKLLLALGFSMLGDILLMFSGLSELYFLGGLGSFLMAHVFYIAFFRNNIRNRNLNKALLACLSIYLVGFLYLLKTGLNGILLLAVPIYALVLAWMVYSAVQFGTQYNKTIKQSVAIGAVLFLISDSLIGLFAFTDISINIPLQRILIMTSYILAQYLIISGSSLSIKRLPGKEY